MSQPDSTELFTNKADSYAKYRAGYPPEAIDKLLSHFSDFDTLRCADIGAGTGIASQLLANRGVNVTAIEPNQSMIDSGIKHPNITYLKSPAENTGLPENTFDMLTSFQAFHWFDFKKSLKEFRRLLKPSGRLALIWNYWDTTHPFTSQYANLIDRATTRNKNRVEPYDGIKGKVKKLRVKILWRFQYLPYFKDVSRITYQLRQEVDLETLLGIARSQSYIKHEGELWDELERSITDLCRENESPELVYSINLFTATPD